LLTTGAVPDTTPPESQSATGKTLTSYQSEFLTLKQQDTAELLYASFLSPSDSLANSDAVLGQAAQLLGTPGSLPSASAAPSAPATSAATAATTSTDPATAPSVASLFAASDAAAQQALSAYANAPAGSSIIDYQA
jgi:hypothetical protein